MCMYENYTLWSWFYSIHFHYYIAGLHIISSFEWNFKKLYDRKINIIHFMRHSRGNLSIFVKAHKEVDKQIKESERWKI